MNVFLRIHTSLLLGSIAYYPLFAYTLHVTSQSPCTDVCSTAASGTDYTDVVCLDSDFAQPKNGSIFQKCVECELGSTAVDATTGTTDVIWALYNMRFAVSSCIFDFPVHVMNQSTPCQVSCQPLAQAIQYNLGDNVTKTSTDLSFCHAGEFDDKTINRCADCYGLMAGEVVMANFLQALHIACHSPPQASQPFAVSTYVIFNSSGVIPGPTPSSTTQSTHHPIQNLALIITLPIVAALAVGVMLCICCFFFLRSRRRKMRATGRMSQLHESWANPPVTPYKSPNPKVTWGVMEPPVMMDQINSPQLVQQRRYSPHFSSTPPREYVENVGPGAGQEKDRQLHNKFFPLVPEATVVQQLAPVPPCLTVPVPMERDKRPDEDFIQYADDGSQSPQVFVYDKVKDRYVKQDESVAK